ncbi:hypothetical protein HYPSUDRAFT_77114, partial [Hypholoma sublateritium FD-334 SS-4]
MSFPTPSNYSQASEWDPQWWEWVNLRPYDDAGGTISGDIGNQDVPVSIPPGQANSQAFTAPNPFSWPPSTQLYNDPQVEELGLSAFQGGYPDVSMASVWPPQASSSVSDPATQAAYNDSQLGDGAPQYVHPQTLGGFPFYNQQAGFPVYATLPDIEAGLGAGYHSTFPSYGGEWETSFGEAESRAMPPGGPARDASLGAGHHPHVGPGAPTDDVQAAIDVVWAGPEQWAMPSASLAGNEGTGGAGPHGFSPAPSHATHIDRPVNTAVDVSSAKGATARRTRPVIRSCPHCPREFTTLLRFGSKWPCSRRSALQPLPRAAGGAEAVWMRELWVQHDVQGGPGTAPEGLPEARGTHSSWDLISDHARRPRVY